MQADIVAKDRGLFAESQFLSYLSLAQKQLFAKF